MAVTVQQITGRSLVSEELFRRLVARVVADEAMERPLAERVVDQAIAFVAVAGRNPDRPLVPSRLVDPGWHAFVLHTVDYARFCRDRVGAFVHHVPTDEGGQETVVVECRARVGVFGCRARVGAFVHHVPTDEGGQETVVVERPVDVLRPTVDALRAAGFHVDEELWGG